MNRFLFLFAIMLFAAAPLDMAFSQGVSLNEVTLDTNSAADGGMPPEPEQDSSPREIIQWGEPFQVPVVTGAPMPIYDPPPCKSDAEGKEGFE